MSELTVKAEGVYNYIYLGNKKLGYISGGYFTPMLQEYHDYNSNLLLDIAIILENMSEGD